MTTSMPRQEENLPPGNCSTNQHIRWRPKRRVDFMLGYIAQLHHLIKPTPPNDPDCWYVFIHPRSN